MPSFNINALFSQAIGQGVTTLKDNGALNVLRNAFLPFPEVILGNEKKPLPTLARPEAIAKLYKDLPTSIVLADKTTRLVLPIPPVIEAQSRANIISTNVAGRNYSIKEIVSVEDTRISLKGIIPPPYKNIVSLSEGGTVEVISGEIDLQFYNILTKLVGRVLDVTCSLINEMGVYSVVVESVNFPDASQYSGVILYQIQLISDNPAELILKDKKITSKQITTVDGI